MNITPARKPPIKYSVSNLHANRQPTGILGEHRHFDEYAEVIRVFAKEILGITDQTALDTINVSYYFGGDLPVKLDGLHEAEAKKLGELLITYSDNTAVADHNNPVNVEFISVPEDADNQCNNLVATIRRIAEAHGLNEQVKEAVLAVQAEQALIAKQYRGAARG